MASFPLLSTAAVTQYPTAVTNGQATQVIRFLDGADQRYLRQPKMLRAWQIQLNLLNEAEIQQIETFFVQQGGDYSSFVFPDPISGSGIPNCRLGAPGIVTEYLGVDVCATSFWVIETYG